MGRGIRHLRGLPGSVVSVRVSQDGKRVAAISYDWWAGVWDRDTGRLIRLWSLPRGQFAGNAGLTFSQDARSLVVSAGNTATLLDLDSGKTRQWPLPWGLTEAILFKDDGHLMLMRSEVSDGSRPPDSEAPPATYPRVCVVRNLLGRQPTNPVKTITDFNWGVQGIEASPDGEHFVVVGLAGMEKANLRRHVRAYRADGTLVTELSTEIHSGLPIQLTFDPTGRLMFHGPDPHPILVEVPSGRSMGLSPIIGPIGIDHQARRWIAQASDDSRDSALRSSGPRLTSTGFRTNPGVPYPQFSPDLDGRYLIWGNRSGAVAVADLVEIQGRLTGLGVGW